MLNGLNLQLQGKGKLICDMNSHIKTFRVKLALLVGQVQKQDFIHLPVTQTVSQLRNQWPHSQLKSQWKRWKCWRRSLTCDSVSYMSTLKKSVFSRTPSLPTLTKPCLVISLSWLSYRTVMFWKTLLSPKVSLNYMLPSLTRHTQTSKGMQLRCPHFLAAHISVSKPFHSWNWWKLRWDQDSLMIICISLWDWLWQEWSLTFEIWPPRSKPTVHTN